MHKTSGGEGSCRDVGFAARLTDVTRSAITEWDYLLLFLPLSFISTDGYLHHMSAPEFLEAHIPNLSRLKD
jgi:hypothetical protein